MIFPVAIVQRIGNVEGLGDIAGIDQDEDVLIVEGLFKAENVVIAVDGVVAENCESRRAGESESPMIADGRSQISNL
jgi:hypothetical protein